MPAPASSLAVVLLALGLASAQQPPALPALPFEKLPPALRERVGEAQARAQREPGSASASGAVAMPLHAHDQFELAEAWYARAHALDAASGDWAYLLAATQAERGRQEEAIRSLRESLAARPSYVPARLKLGELLLARGQVEAAAPVYEDLLKDDPGLPHAHHGLARVEAARGRAAAAVEREKRAIELFPAYGAAHYSLGLLYRDLGQLDQARAALALSETHRLTAPALDDPLLLRVRQLRTGPRALLAEGARLGKAGDLEAAVRVHDNADGIGARVGLLRKGAPTLWRRAHSDGSYLVASDPRVWFGLGPSSGPQSLLVQWPSGRKEMWTAPGIDRVVTLREGTGRPWPEGLK